MADVIYTVRHRLNRHLATKKTVCLAFVDLEKAFDMVVREGLKWAIMGRSRFKYENG